MKVSKEIGNDGEREREREREKEQDREVVRRGEMMVNVLTWATSVYKYADLV